MLRVTKASTGEYVKITNKDNATGMAQLTLNSLCEHTRNVISMNPEAYLNNNRALMFIRSTNI